MATRRRQPAKTELSQEQIDIVLSVLSVMIEEERARPNNSMTREERGRGAIDRVARKLGVTQQSVSSYMSGAYNPGLSVATALHNIGRLDFNLFCSNPELSITDPDVPALKPVTSEQIERVREETALIREHLRNIEKILGSEE